MVFKSWSFPLLAALCWSGAALAADRFTVKDGKVQVVSSVGSTKWSSEFTSSSRPSADVTTLNSADTLRLNFVVSSESTSDSESTNKVLPHQSFALFSCPKTGRSTAFQVKVRKGGKGKYELLFSPNTTPASVLSLPSSPSDTIDLELLLGGFGDVEPLRLKLAQLKLDSNLVIEYPVQYEDPLEWESERFLKREEIGWTFRGGEKEVPSAISLLATALAFSPWVVLVGLISQIKPTLLPVTPRIVAFLLSLAGFEALLVYYWVSFTLFPFIPWFLGVGLVTVITGREALGDVKNRRIRAETGKTE